MRESAGSELVVFVPSAVTDEMLCTIRSALAAISAEIRVMPMPEPPIVALDPIVAWLVASKGLTERHRDVLPFVLRGWSDQEIARTLGVAVGTIKDHVSDIRHRAGVPTRMRLLELVFHSSVS